MDISAYIPCFNNRATLADTIRSLQSQQPPVDDLWVIDDGSTDGSGEIARSLGTKLVRHDQNLGRGAARARAMQETRQELVLGVDATVVVPPDFLSRAMAWFGSQATAAVCGRAVDPHADTVVRRWQARHVYQDGARLALTRTGPLASGACLVRKPALTRVGGFNPRLRHGEDHDLGLRLLASGYEVIADPALTFTCHKLLTVNRALERYWRWYTGPAESLSVKGYVRHTAFAVKVMAREDLAARDPAGALLSLVCPHYYFWHTVLRRMLRRAQVQAGDAALRKPRG